MNKFITVFMLTLSAYAGASAANYITVTADEDYSDDIYVTDSTFIYNYGIISGTIHVSDSYSVQITNYNQITSSFDIGAYNANFTQMINEPGNATVINNLSGHVVRVEGASYLNMSGVISAGEYAGRIELAASSFLVGGGMPMFDIPIIVDDDVIFFVTGANEDESIPLMTNIIGHPVLQVRGIDSMYLPELDLVGGSLYVHLARMVNYDEVIGGDLGSFLDSLRDVNPNDRLIGALDVAQNRAQLNQILGESVRTNPIRLTRPMRTFANMDDLRVFGEDNLTLSLRPFYVMSQDFGIYGINASFYKSLLKDLTGCIGLFGATMNFDGPLDEFSGFLYGGKIGADYRDSNLYVGARGLVMGGSFSDLVVFDGVRPVKNPNAMNADFVFDIGPVYRAFDDVNIVPFVGGNFNYASALDYNETDVSGRIGIETLFDTVQDGNKYDIGFRASLDTNSTVYVSLRTDMMSTADGMGGGLDVVAVHDDMGWSWKIGLNAKFVF